MDVLNQFMDEYFPEKNPLKAPIVSSKKFLQEFEGAYRVNRFAYNDITTISSLLSHIKVSMKDSTKLKIVSGENVKYYVPIDSLTFREENTSSVVAFRRGKDGAIANMFLGELPILALDKVSGLQSAGVQSIIFAIVLIVMLVVIFYVPFSAYTRVGYRPVGSFRGMSQGTRWLVWFNYLLLFIFFAGLVIVLSNPEDIVYGVPGALKLLLAIPLLCILLTIGMLVNWFKVIGNGEYRVSSRLLYTIITFVSVAALWQLNYWNFIGYNY
jgi:hypothetical protein